VTNVNVLEGKPVGSKYKIGIVVSRFNDPIGKRLLSGALKTLEAKGLAGSDIDVVWVPGAWEIPVVASKLDGTAKYQGLIALGAIVEGKTSHHEYIANEVATALRQLTQKTGIPVAFGVLTTASVNQALARSSEKREGNKGSEAAEHLLETLSVIDQIRHAD